MNKKINLYGDSPCVEDKSKAKRLSLETVNPKIYRGKIKTKPIQENETPKNK